MNDMTGQGIRFAGIGGETMQKAGLKSLFPMNELSVMGVFEVLPKVPHLLKRIRQTIDDIIEKQPDVILTVDSPDFCFRVIKGLKKRGYAKPCVHYVAPSVWAWRPKRAAYVAQFLDHLFCLLPFEPPYFEAHGLDTTYVGHSAVEGGAMHAQASRFRKKYDIPSSQTILTLLPGSREGEINRHLDLFLDTAQDVQKRYQKMQVVIPTLSQFKDGIKEKLEARKIQGLVIDSAEDKYDAFAASAVALAASGTVTLELALTNTPTVVSYKMSPLTAFLAKRLVKLEYVSLVNLILQRKVVPEHLLENARVGTLSDSLIQILDGNGAKHQKSAFSELREVLRADDEITPSMIAAQKLLQMI
jgi:lipid-A-disaccharide synthase